MNSCEMREERLNDYVDGLLTGADRADLDRHMAQCEGCREAVEALSALKGAASALPGSLEPPRDLWPEIRRGLSGSGDSPWWRVTGRRPASSWGWRVGLAAAAVMLVAASVSITLLVVRPRPESTVAHGTAASVPPGPAVLASYRAAENVYLRATGDLMAVLDDRRDELAPETVELLEENLRLIDEAINQMWSALENDPAHSGNRHLFNNLYQKKVTLLRQAVRLPAQS